MFMNDVSNSTVSVTYDIKYEYPLPGWIMAAAVGGLNHILSRVNNQPKGELLDLF
jgi:hypothetical protein